MKGYKIQRVCRGSYRGLKKRKDIEEPVCIVTGYYDTVRSGTLEIFYVLIPEKDYEWIEESSRSDIIFHKDFKWAYRIYIGDAESASRFEPVDVEYVMRLVEEHKEAEKLLYS